MSEPQTIKTESGEELVVLHRRDYDALLARLGDEEAEDRMTERLVAEAKARPETALPLEVWDEIAEAPSPIGPIRKHRGLNQVALAEAAGISQGFLSEMEAGKKTGDVKTLRRVARALRVDLHDIAPPSLHSTVRRAVIADEIVHFTMTDDAGETVYCAVTRDFIEEKYGGRDIPEDELNAAFEVLRGEIEALASKKYARGERPDITIDDLIPPAKPGAASFR